MQSDHNSCNEVEIRSLKYTTVNVKSRLRLSGFGNADVMYV